MLQLPYLERTLVRVIEHAAALPPLKSSGRGSGHEAMGRTTPATATTNGSARNGYVAVPIEHEFRRLAEAPWGDPELMPPLVSVSTRAWPSSLPIPGRAAAGTARMVVPVAATVQALARDDLVSVRPTPPRRRHGRVAGRRERLARLSMVAFGFLISIAAAELVRLVRR
jgi:hypothetical protein